MALGVCVSGARLVAVPLRESLRQPVLYCRAASECGIEPPGVIARPGVGHNGDDDVASLELARKQRLPSAEIDLLRFCIGNRARDSHANSRLPVTRCRELAAIGALQRVDHPKYLVLVTSSTKPAGEPISLVQAGGKS